MAGCEGMTWVEARQRLLQTSKEKERDGLQSRQGFSKVQGAMQRNATQQRKRSNRPPCSLARSTTHQSHPPSAMRALYRADLLPFLGLTKPSSSASRSGSEVYLVMPELRVSARPPYPDPYPDP